jgi:tripartite-type tricarboxylate transporter receptor subunit TctC
LGQPVIVDNKPGADGAIGATGVLKSPPDGYTLLLGTASVILGVPALHKNPPYHPLTDFTPVTSLGRNTFFLFVHPSVPAKTLGELIAYARANPNKLSYGSGGTFQILLTAQLAKVADIKMVHVPYKGDPPAILDLLAGRIQVLFSVVTTTLAYAKEGRLRVLATLVRSSLAPDVPTMEEAGTPMSSIPPTWWGIFGPAKMPREIVARLSKELNQILRHPDVRAQLERQGLESQGSSPEEFATHLREQLDVWTRGVRESGLVQD